MDRHALLYPTVIEHAAAFLEKSPWEVSRDRGLLFAAHARAHEAYGDSPIVCGIDVHHTEAEAWGAKVLPFTGGSAVRAAQLHAEETVSSLEISPTP